MKLSIGLPKGSLQEATFDLFRKAGFDISVSSSRSYYPTIDDGEIQPVLLRAQEIPRYVEESVLDAGITGKDWVMENQADVVEVEELIYGKQSRHPVRWVLAVPNDSAIKTVKGLQGKRIATEVVNLTRQYLKRHRVQADVEFSWGATEVKVPHLVDAIVELTETGSSLRAHNLRIVDTVAESTTRLIVNKSAWQNKKKKKKLQNIALLLKGALEAWAKVGIKMNISERNLDKVLRVLPALKTPTVSSLSKKGWFALEVIVEEKVIRDMIPQLKEAGAEGIIEYPLNKVIY